MDWVSVKDRLPNVMENVLVYWKNTSQGKEYYETTYYDGYDWFTKMWRKAPAFRHGDISRPCSPTFSCIRCLFVV